MYYKIHPESITPLKTNSRKTLILRELLSEVVVPLSLKGLYATEDFLINQP
jgi:hypothetical protein